jgi:hypothetical protein
MKVFLHYEDNGNEELFKSLKITLPKSWKNGPNSNLLEQFIESYNATKGETNPLNAEEMHLCIRQPKKTGGTTTETEFVPLCSDGVVLEDVPDRGDVYICHGRSLTKSEKDGLLKKEEEELLAKNKNTVACTHFGCQKRFPKGGPYPECRYHKLVSILFFCWKRR